MKRLILITLCSFLLCGCSSSLKSNSSYYNTPPSDPIIIGQNVDQNTTNLATKVSSAVVGVSCGSGDYISLGSGVCVASGGYILTNEHVISAGGDITLYLSDGSSTSAILVWKDSSMDIAVLKSAESLPYLVLADTDMCQVGEDVIAIGTPINLQFKHTVTKGIISALNRTLLVSTSHGNTYMQNLIQHDASINPGNSGGPLINSQGQVVGINTLKITDSEGMGFAIPSKSFTSIVGNITKLGTYITPYTGIFGYDAQIAKYYNQTDRTEGVYVTDVSTDSPAYSLGIREGDVITSVNDQTIHNMLDLRDELFKHNVNDSINMTIFRDGVEHSVDITLTKHPVNNIN